MLEMQIVVASEIRVTSQKNSHVSATHLNTFFRLSIHSFLLPRRDEGDDIFLAVRNSG